METRERFKLSWPGCARLECNDECDHLEAHCGRAAEVFEAHNRSVKWTGLEQLAEEERK